MMACTSLLAQVKKADKYFDNLQYAKAIPLYKKASNKKKTKEYALDRLGSCYRITRQFVLAEKCYSELSAMKGNDPMVHFYYAEALLNNNKYEEAKKEFNRYSELKPDDKKGKLYARSCDDIKSFSVKPAAYKAYNLKEVNTPVSDFSPVLYKDGLIFASEVPKDILTGNASSYNGHPPLSLVYAKAEKKKDSMVFAKARPFSPKFNNDDHNGPACFTADGNEVYFTRVMSDGHSKKGSTNYAKIYHAQMNGIKPKNIELLPFNSDNYSTGHPSISQDGSTLFFASNMPGGYGGTDIYMVKKNGGTWGSPVNLGAEVNTSGDENFPFISSANVIYFSSNGHVGFGGLDIFYASENNGKWGNVHNMMPPVNSTGDDFGIYMNEEKKSGYFSSNREGGKGGDDIWAFVLSGRLTTISGKILLSSNVSDGASSVKILLLTDQGNFVQNTTTDASGFFRFENINPEWNYTIKIDEDDAALKSRSKFYLADSKNRTVRFAVKGPNGLCVFENLPSDLTSLKKLDEADVPMTTKNISIAGNLFAGDDKTPLSNAKVNLKNDKGDIVQSTRTNEFGSFAFTELPPDQNYIVAVEEMDPQFRMSKIYMTNKSGKQIGVSDESLEFRFQLLASDKQSIQLMKVEDADLRIDIKGKLLDADKKPIANSRVSIINSNGSVVQSGMTDANGNFVFPQLPADPNYIVTMDEKDVALNKRVFLADDKGRILGEMKADGSKKFRFQLLASEQKKIGTIYVDDPWLKVQKLKSTKKDSLLIIENIYYDYGSAELLDPARLTLDKLVKVMKENADISVELDSYTDSRGTTDFNMELSNKRAKNAVDYAVSKGIDKKRLSGKGLGESKILNRCTDGVECSEEEHAVNRRTEFKISRAKK